MGFIEEGDVASSVACFLFEVLLLEGGGGFEGGWGRGEVGFELFLEELLFGEVLACLVDHLFYFELT